LRTPSVKAVAKLLIERDGIDPELAEFASSAAQGHIGRAKYLATNEEARKTREKILNLPSSVSNLSSAFEAANTLLEMAKEQAKAESEFRNEEELSKLKELYGTTGSRLATGGAKAIKDLQKEQKNRITRSIKDSLDLAIIYLAETSSEINFNSGFTTKDQEIKMLCSLLNARKNLTTQSSLLLILESLFSEIILIKTKVA
jgi:DNA polymerase-3 subunit delta'